MSYHWAVGVSFVSALLYHVSYRGFMCCMIDDAVAAGAVHLVAGAWGLVAAGFTGVEAARVEAGYQPEHVCSRGSQTLVNLLMTVIIFVYVVACTWVLWGVLSILRLVKIAQAGKVVGKAEPEGIARLKDDLVRRDLAISRQANEKEEKIEFQLDQLVSRVHDLGTNRLNDVEARLSAGVEDIAGLVERVNQLEKRATSTSSSALGETASPDIATRRRDYAAQKEGRVHNIPWRSPTPAQSIPREKSCRVS